MPTRGVALRDLGAPSPCPGHAAVPTSRSLELPSLPALLQLGTPEWAVLGISHDPAPSQPCCSPRKVPACTSLPVPHRRAHQHTRAAHEPSSAAHPGSPLGPPSPLFPPCSPREPSQTLQYQFSLPCTKINGAGRSSQGSSEPRGSAGEGPCPERSLEMPRAPPPSTGCHGTGQQDLQRPRDGAGVHGLHLNNPSTARLHSQSFHPEPRSHLAAEPSAPLCL